MVPVTIDVGNVTGRPDSTGAPLVPSNLEFEPRVLLRPVRDASGQVTDATFVAVNVAAARAMGTTPDALVGHDAIALDPRMERSKVLAVVRQAAERDAPVLAQRVRDVDFRSGRPITFDAAAQRHGNLVELTWRNRTGELELQRSYQFLAEHASDVVFRADVDTVITWASPSSLTVLGWSPTDLLGTEATALLHPEDLPRIPEWLAELERDRRLEVEVRLRHAEGTYSYFRVQLVLVEEHDGTAEVVGSLRDVDEAVRTRQRLESLSERYRLVAEHASNVVVRGHRDGRIEWIFDSVEGLLGWRPEDLEGRRFDELVHPDDLRHVEAIRRTVGRGEPGRAEVRLRHRNGDYRWTAITVQDVIDQEGQPSIRLAWWRDIEAEVHQRAVVAATEARYRLLAENASDVVWQLDAHGTFAWMSPSVELVLGWRPDDLLGRPLTDLNVAADRATHEHAHATVLRGDSVLPFESRFRVADGTLRWLRAHYRPLRHEGQITGVVVALQDLDAAVRARRAAAALASGNAILVRAVTEEALLADLCQNLVDTTGYALAWYGRPVVAPGSPVSVVASSKHLREYVDSITVTWDDSPTSRGPTGTALRTGEAQIVNDLQHDPRFALWAERAASYQLAASIALPVHVGGHLDGAFTVYSDTPRAFDEQSVELLISLASQVGIGVERLRERDQLSGALQQATLLRTAIDQAAESVVVTDLTPHVVYANPAAARTTGHDLSEMIGQNPRLWQSGLHDEAFYQELWATLLAGRTWRNHVINRRASGELYEVDAVISPVVDSQGVTTAYVAVERDLTAEHQLEADVERQERDAVQLAELMSESRTSYDLATAASELGDQLLALDFIDFVAIYRHGPDTSYTLLAMSGDPEVVRVGREMAPTLPDVWVQMMEFRARVRRVDLTHLSDTESSPILKALAAEGFTVAVLVPMRWNGRTIGALSIASRVGAGMAGTPRSSVFEELGSFTGSHLGPQFGRDERHEILRAGVADIIASGRYHPVFQPIVELATGEVRGYEALTRFDDGRSPDEHFAEATAAHLTTELELACASRALAEAAQLPGGGLLTVNLSPTSLLRPDTHALLTGASRELGVELTEHSAISDYSALRQILGGLPDLRLLVDDAGAGYASMRHILELHPDIVKLDISLVRGIDQDEAKQALVAGMRRFAARTAMTLLAEGVETAAEAQVLEQLGVELAQGYHFSRPLPVAHWRTPGPPS
ncbi:MAG: PAS domain S-box protein [Acidimicrobiales bacterium]